MIKYIIFFILVCSQVAFGATNLTLQFSSAEIKQGSLETTKLLLNADAVQKISLQKLKGQTLGDTIYIYGVSPLMRKEGSNSFEADAKVIFVKIPETNTVAFKQDAEDLLVTWGNVKITPTEAAKGFIFGNFEIPSRPKIILWASILIGLGLISGTVLWGRKKLQHKAALKAKSKALKTELLSAKTYPEVVDVWKKKHSFITAFPQIETSLKDFEVVLFKYQFKPRQSEVEINAVMEAYRDFVRKVEGGLSGV